MRGYLAILGFIGAIGALFLGIGWLAGMDQRRDLALCEDAIKAQLKAPATYQRVEFSGVLKPDYRITYDAQNSFGVPLRGSGYCTVDAKGVSAKWLELG